MSAPVGCKHVNTGSRVAALENHGRYYHGRWTCPWCEDWERACREAQSIRDRVGTWNGGGAEVYPDDLERAREAQRDGRLWAVPTGCAQRAPDRLKGEETAQCSTWEVGILVIADEAPPSMATCSDRHRSERWSGTLPERVR